MNIRFFPFPYTRSFCKLTQPSRAKSFSSYDTVFLIMRVLRSNFSANAMVRAYFLLRHPSFISGVFTLLNWRKFLLGLHLFFTFPATLPPSKFHYIVLPPYSLLLIDERLIPVCSEILRGARCACGASSCEQTKSNQLLGIFFCCCWPRRTKTFFSIHGVTIFKTLQTSKSSFSMNVLSKFYTQTTLFLHNHFKWWLCLLLKTPLWTDSDEKTLWAKRQFVNNI